MMSKRIADRIMVIGFVSALFATAGAFVVLPKGPFSELENRYLQRAPELTWAGLKSKQYTEDAEKYVTDHFPLRDDWVGLKSAMEQLRWQQENNGIYKGKDGYLFEKFEEPDYAKVTSYAEAIRAFARQHPEADMTFLLAPTSVGLYPERLPWKAHAYPQSQVNDYVGGELAGSLTFLDGFDALRPHASEALYYKTDHHWTTLGAYYAYAAYAEQMGWKALGKADFDLATVSDSFLGSYHTRSQFTGLTADSIQAWVPKVPVQSEMYIADTGETVSGLYDESFLGKKDQYGYFMGGVHALATIKSGLDANAADLDKLLVIKDSYAHSFLPFLAQHVSEIHVIDMRYFNGSIGDYMAANGIKDVLMLFNTSTYVENDAVLKIDNK